MTSSTLLADSFAPFPNRVAPGARIAGGVDEGEAHALPDPSTGDTYAQVGWVDSATANQAVDAAADARTHWAGTSARDRAAALRGIAAAIREHAEFYADLVMLETGKRRQEARGEAHFSAAYFDWFAEAATMPAEQHLANAQKRFIVRRHPVGVVAAVSPWNFPLSIPARKVAPALAAGCPVVMKPSELTPLSALALTELCEQHLPAGVVNAVNGSGETLTTSLVDHRDVAALTFTGSTPVGTLVASRAMHSMTRTTMELGGKAPFVICADADPAVAVDALMVAKFRNNGASCIAANNIWIHRDQYDTVMAELTDRITGMRVGDPRDENVDLGPMLRADHVSRLDDMLTEADDAGCPVTRGHTPDSAGYFASPALVEANKDVKVWNDEIFGPVLAVREFDTEESVVTEANGWNYGLGGYVVSGDVRHGIDLASQLRIGIVGINNGAPNTPEVPFGGFGFSGLGREGGLSGVLEFTEEQTLSVAR